MHENMQAVYIYVNSGSASTVAVVDCWVDFGRFATSNFEAGANTIRDCLL